MHLIEQQINSLIVGNFDEAWEISKKIEHENLVNLESEFNKGWMLIKKGNFGEGFKLLEKGRELNVYGDKYINTNKPIWNKDCLDKKTVILYLESGPAEYFTMIRFAREIHKKNGTCIVCCHESFHSLFSKIPEIKKLITLEQISKTEHDFWIPSLSCPLLFECSSEMVCKEPYIFANQNSINLWKNLIKTEKKYKVGLYWADDLSFQKKQEIRWFPPEKLIDISKNKDVCFYSLQKYTDEIKLSENICDLQHFLISWDDVAACIQLLDLVITSSSSIGHLAAGMGKEVWFILPVLSDPILAYGEEYSPWYGNNVKLFRQKTFGEWELVFNQIQTQLEQKIK